MKSMRIIRRSALVEYWGLHPETKASLENWITITRRSSWFTMSEVQAAFPKAKIINAERVRFEVAGGNYRLIAAFYFPASTVFIKFLGTHAEYDRIDAATVANY